MRGQNLRQVAEREVVGVGELQRGVRAGTVGILVTVEGIHRFLSLHVRTCVRRCMLGVPAGHAKLHIGHQLAIAVVLNG
jgi:hypothetical protein